MAGKLVLELLGQVRNAVGAELAKATPAQLAGAGGKRALELYERLGAIQHNLAGIEHRAIMAMTNSGSPMTRRAAVTASALERKIGGKV